MLDCENHPSDTREMRQLNRGKRFHFAKFGSPQRALCLSLFLSLSLSSYLSLFLTRNVLRCAFALASSARRWSLPYPRLRYRADSRYSRYSARAAESR